MHMAKYSAALQIRLNPLLEAGGIKGEYKDSHDDRLLNIF